MAVIAKMSVAALRLFSDGNCLLNLSCVYDSNLSTPDNEDVRFTKASPFGTASITIGKGPDVPQAGKQVYVLFHDQGDVPNFDDCEFALLANCQSILDSGHTKQVEVVGGWWSGDAADFPIPEAKRITNNGGGPFHLKMGIDNPGAHVQFVPTKQYWVTVYAADKVTMDEALRLARA